MHRTKREHSGSVRTLMLRDVFETKSAVAVEIKFLPVKKCCGRNHRASERGMQMEAGACYCLSGGIAARFGCAGGRCAPDGGRIQLRRRRKFGNQFALDGDHEHSPRDRQRQSIGYEFAEYRSGGEQPTDLRCGNGECAAQFFRDRRYREFCLLFIPGQLRNAFHQSPISHVHFAKRRNQRESAR